MKYPTMFVEKSLSGKMLSVEDARIILQSSGAELTTYLAGAQQIKETYFSNQVKLCSIINAKSGRCTEDCSFCAQSIYYQTNAPTYPLKSINEIFAGAKQAERAGSHCYSIVTSGTRVEPGEEFERILTTIKHIKAETIVNPSVSLGILEPDNAKLLAKAGCKTYHHNLETARSFFTKICTTHDYEEDIETINCAKKAGMKVCCGGIFGLGESLEQRIELGLTLRELDVDSVPINFLSPVPGTPLEGTQQLTPLDCVRTICLYRYLLPNKLITICGGREKNLREFQSVIFMAGANGMMIGNYLTTRGRDLEADLQMLKDAEVTIYADS